MTDLTTMTSKNGSHKQIPRLDKQASKQASRQASKQARGVDMPGTEQAADKGLQTATLILTSKKAQQRRRETEGASQLSCLDS